MAVFLVIGAPPSSCSASMRNFLTTSNTIGLNITLRNALSQIEKRYGEAGDGFYRPLSTSNTPVGITIVNNTLGGAVRLVAGTFKRALLRPAYRLTRHLHAIYSTPSGAVTPAPQAANDHCKYFPWGREVHRSSMAPETR